MGEKGRGKERRRGGGEERSTFVFNSSFINAIKIHSSSMGVSEEGKLSFTTWAEPTAADSPGVQTRHFSHLSGCIALPAPRSSTQEAVSLSPGGNSDPITTSSCLVDLLSDRKSVV